MGREGSIWGWTLTVGVHPQGAADTIRIELLHVGSRNVPGRMPDLAPCGEAILFLMAMSFC